MDIPVSTGTPPLELVNTVYEHARLFFDADIEHNDVRELVEEAYRATDLNYGAEVAARWREREFPEGIPHAKIDEHEALLVAAGGDFAAMAEQRLQRVFPRSMGMHVPLEPGFEPDGADEVTGRTRRRGRPCGRYTAGRISLWKPSSSTLFWPA